MIKIIGIGNLLMGDDGVGVKAIQKIEDKINKLNLNIKCIQAETDVNYALDNIENGDFLFIIDSTLLGKKAGEITQISLEEASKYKNNSLSIHNMSLLSLIKNLDIEVKGIILGIEVIEVSFSLDISQEIKESFEQICEEVYEIILEYIKKGEANA